MKKIITFTLLIGMSAMVHAAAFNWNAANIYDSSTTAKYSGDVTLHCVQLADWSVTATVVEGVVNKKNTEFSSDKFVAGTSYDFYFTFEDGGKRFTSSTKNGIMAQASDVANINFGNLQSATQNASNWQVVPEPTSGLMLLLGVAGLALKRKRA